MRQEYINNMTGGGAYHLRARMENEHEKDRRPGEAGEETGPGGKKFLTLTICKRYGITGETTTNIKGTFVHEQAHIWNIASGDSLATGLRNDVHGLMVNDVTDTKGPRYRTIDNITSYDTNYVEDWADTVMILTYPTHGRANKTPDAWSDERKSYLRGVAPGARIP